MATEAFLDIVTLEGSDVQAVLGGLFSAATLEVQSAWVVTGTHDLNVLIVTDDYSGTLNKILLVPGVAFISPLFVIQV